MRLSLRAEWGGLADPDRARLEALLLPRHGLSRDGLDPRRTGFLDAGW
ncbi:MAG: hypothetical protein JRS35_19645 [Deltaproteobacteria bacterium]|nr:hypothetical protein [Deltaproteobacteria bacterium]